MVFKVGCVVAAALFMSGCQPRLIQDYTVRGDDLVFAVQHGKRYSLGTCKRKLPSGALYDCVDHEVEFDD